MIHAYAIAIGSNRRSRHGSPSATLHAAVTALAEVATVIRVSPVVATPALGPAGRGFANAAVLIESPLDPPALLVRLKAIERGFGRRRGRRWGARVIDLDILLWSGGTWPRRGRTAAPGRLAVPHRVLAERGFVLDPLVRIAPAWRAAGRSIRQLHARLHAARAVDRIAGTA